MKYQLDFFAEEKSDLEYLRDDLERVRESNVGRHAELAKKYLELHERMQILERNICRGEFKK